MDSKSRFVAVKKVELMEKSDDDDQKDDLSKEKNGGNKPNLELRPYLLITKTLGRHSLSSTFCSSITLS